MLARIEFRTFRNLEPGSLELPAGGTLVLGENGAGKTSLLEAIYTLSTSRSFRARKLVDCIARPGVRRHSNGPLGSEVAPPTVDEGAGDGEDEEVSGFRLAGETRDRQRLDLYFDGEQRRRRLNGEKVPLSRYLGVQPVIAWTVSDLDVLIGPPAARRRFMDRGVVALRPSSIDGIARYRRALAEKRSLLQQGCRARDLEPWNLVLAAAAAGLMERRFDYVRRLERTLDTVAELCELDLGSIDLAYRPSPKGGETGEEVIIDRLEAEAEREIAAQVPLYGPHRDELRIRFRGAPVRDVASAGERKAIGLLLTAAHALLLEEADIEPVFLLDDVDTELDEKRLLGLWRYFGRAGQLLATSNRPFVFRELPFNQRIHAVAGTFESTRQGLR
ncbi:MAG: AAA family ATPase [Acidobacteriota bacterium]